MILEHIDARRIVAKPGVLDETTWPTGTLALRIAEDDVLLVDVLQAVDDPHPVLRDGDLDEGGLDDDDVTYVIGGPMSEDLLAADPHAIIAEDAGWSGIWLTGDEVESIARHDIHWPLPAERPAFVQGLVAAIPAKLWLGTDGEALLLVATVSVDEMQERLS